MANDKTGGGEAFANGYGGMTLRDYFAGQVICGAVQSGKFALAGPGAITDDILARHAYNVADAMLEARDA